MGSGVQFPSGFSGRYELIVRQLAQAGHELLVIDGITPRGPANPGDELVHDRGTTRLRVGRGTYRWPEARVPNRLKSIARVYCTRAGRTGWERAASKALRAWSPDVVLALAPWQPILAGLGPRGIPVALFAEEDLSIHQQGEHERKPRARWKEWLRVAMRPAPRVVVVIASKEERWAAQQFPRSTVLVVPHAIDLDYWSPGGPGADRAKASILCAGDFRQARNFAGLDHIAQAFTSEQAKTLTCTIASAYPPPDKLLSDHGALLQYLGAVEDLRPLYERSTLSLVPAFTVTGVKTQILQAWAMGCPVVTTAAGAASVGGTSGEDLLAGESPDEVAAHIAAVVADPAMALHLSANGVAQVKKHFSQSALMESMDQLLNLLTKKDPA